MINELDLLWVPNFIALEIYFIFGTKFFWNKVIDTYLNIEYVLLGCHVDFIGGYLVVTARYWWFLLVNARYCSFPLLVWTTKASFLNFGIGITMLF